MLSGEGGCLGGAVTVCVTYDLGFHRNVSFFSASKSGSTLKKNEFAAEIQSFSI